LGVASVRMGAFSPVVCWCPRPLRLLLCAPHGWPFVAAMCCGGRLCCECGVGITPNASSMCMVCLSSRVDITQGIPKQIVVYQCRECLRFAAE
jgi:hypothetical protein